MTAQELIDALQREPEYLDRQVFFTLYPNEDIEELQMYNVTDVTFQDDGSSPFTIECKPGYVELICYE